MYNVNVNKNGRILFSKKRCIEWYIAHHAPHTKIGLSISTGTSATRTVSITESFHHVAEGDCFVYYYLLQLPMVI
jgi:hypothetical protein